jgi:hypothetical protein
MSAPRWTDVDADMDSRGSPAGLTSGIIGAVVLRLSRVTSKNAAETGVKQQIAVL